jgi:hypothetical protein
VEPALPSNDPRFNDAAGDIWQHRINNFDWDIDWVFYDSYLLAKAPAKMVARLNAAIVSGSGAGQRKGILNSSATAVVVRD